MAAKQQAPTPLKRELFERQITVTRLASETGINRTRLSDIVNGRGLATHGESEAITEYLDIAPDKLGWESA